MNNRTTDSTVSDFDLARRVRELDAEIQPERDLWKGIERQLLDHPLKQPWYSRDRLLPYAVAASLVMATSAFVMNLANMSSTSQTMASTTGVEEIQRSYSQVQNPMMEEFSRTNESLGKKNLNLLYANLDILEKARKDLEFQVRTNPENTRLVELLMKVHEQELELLKQDYTSASRSM